MELAASLLGLRADVVYPTLNDHTPAPTCRLNIMGVSMAAVFNALRLLRIRDVRMMVEETVRERRNGR